MTIQEIAQENVAFQWISFFFAIEILVAEIFQLVFNKDKTARYWILAMVLAVVHSIIFYGVLNLDRYTTLPITPLGGSYTTWSSILRLQWYGTIGIIEGFRAWILWIRIKYLIVFPPTSFIFQRRKIRRRKDDN